MGFYKTFIATLICSFTLFMSSTHHVQAGENEKDRVETALSLPFTKQIFTAAQTSGKHIVVEIWKKGCPTCKAQKPTIEAAKKRHPNAVFLDINFSEQKKDVNFFNVNKQSTIIVFKGQKETGRVTGETNPEKLITLMKSGA